MWIYSLLEAQYDDTKELYASMLEGAPLDLRVNLLKASREEVLQELAANGVEAYPTPFSPTASLPRSPASPSGRSTRKARWTFRTRVPSSSPACSPAPP